MTISVKKNIHYYLIALMVSGLLFTGCTDNPSGIEPVDMTVNTTFAEGYESSEASGAAITLTNVNSQETFEGEINDSGQASFQDLPSGNYNISIVLTLDPDAVYELTGNYPDAEEVTFNGSISDFVINSNTENPTVELNAGRLGDLVIKQVYYAGSDVIDGARFRDQFIEIYNNSNEAININGLYIMAAHGNRDQEGASFETESGQYDWNQSIGMPADINANEDYLYGIWVYQVPDDGSETMLEPGKSFVIAQTALNHKEPFTDADGEAVSVNDPSLTVDLSDAEFEVYLGDDIENPYPTDIDNPDVTNLRNVYIDHSDLILDAPGREAYAIFRRDEAPSEWDAYPDPETQQVNNETQRFPQIPTEDVIDAVQIQPSPSNQIPMILQDKIDAGYTYVPGGSFSSNSVIRIEAKTVDGRTILKDTNNSEEDFTHLERAEPKVAAPTSSNGASRMLIQKNQGKTKTFDSFFEETKSRWAPGINH